MLKKDGLPAYLNIDKQTPPKARNLRPILLRFRSPKAKDAGSDFSAIMELAIQMH